MFESFGSCLLSDTRRLHCLRSTSSEVDNIYVPHTVDTCLLLFLFPSLSFAAIVSEWGTSIVEVLQQDLSNFYMLVRWLSSDLYPVALLPNHNPQIG